LSESIHEEFNDVFDFSAKLTEAPSKRKRERIRWLNFETSSCKLPAIALHTTNGISQHLDPIAIILAEADTNRAYGQDDAADLRKGLRQAKQDGRCGCRGDLRSGFTAHHALRAHQDLAEQAACMMLKTS